MKMFESSLTKLIASSSLLIMTKMMTQAAAAAIMIRVIIIQMGFAYVLQNPLFGFPAKLLRYSPEPGDLPVYSCSSVPI